MFYYGMAAGVVGLIVFLLLRPRGKVLIAFFVMTLCFDVAPRLIFNTDVWDLGAVLLFIAWLQLTFLKAKTPSQTFSHVVLIRFFIGWMFVCLLWSILIYGYPALDTLKASRQMIIGFSSFFVFLRLFSIDPGAFGFFMRSLYIATFLLLPVCIVQYVTNTPLLFGLITDYGGAVRALPVFLPICLLNFWLIVSKALTADRVAKHEIVYAGLVIVVTALTFTRGIYFSVFCMSLVMLITLTAEKKLNIRAAMIVFSVSAFCVVLFLFGGWKGKVINRVTSGIEVLFSKASTGKHDDVDTFGGRLALAQERFSLVAKHNPIIGYGFIHEDNVPSAMRAKFKYGSVIYAPEYVEMYRHGQPYVLALHSADIGWADVIVNTGILGLFLFILILGSIAFNYYRNSKVIASSAYHFRLAFFLQTITLALLMFNGNTFIVLVQIPALMLAGYSYSNKLRDESHPASLSTAIAT
ncbi:MAG: O-antigen ligase family protein [Nitrospira sp.]|nr:O-antigen ligase family protein [Nitrospira sp.]